MSNDYTRPIQDGTNESLRDFALRCAGRFNACFRQGSQTKREIEPHVVLSHRNVQAALAAAEQMTLEKAETEWAAHVVWFDKVVAEANETRRLERERYAKMRAQVEAWPLPTPEHTELKVVMLRELDEAVAGSKPIGPGDWGTPSPDAATFRAESIKRAREDQARSQKCYEDHLAQVAKDNAWLEALWAGLPAEST